MEQPRQAEHLWSPLLWALTPGSGLAKLARGWGLLSWGTPAPPNPQDWDGAAAPQLQLPPWCYW